MFAGVGAAQLLIVLLIVTILFGGKKIRQLGSDLGASIRDFKKGVAAEDNKEPGP